jgi:hypothetical protein
MVVQFGPVIGGLDAKRPGHAKVHDERVTGGQVGEQVFRSAPQSQHGRTRDSPVELARKWPAQIASPEHDAANLCAFEDWRELASHGLHFRKFRH